MSMNAHLQTAATNTRTPEDRHRVVIVGGGFGGLQAALHLARLPVDITLFDRRNFHLFQPLAYQVATGALSPAEISYPLRRVFRRRSNVRVVLAEVTDFDLDAGWFAFARSRASGHPRLCPMTR
jgi:NADH dehydrogenase FAD-containing subunit